MNQNRTIGIEIETFCNVSRYTLADALTSAFAGAGIGMSAMAVGYQHQCDANNRTIWYVKPDGSLDVYPRGYHEQAEVCSPVLQGDAGLHALKIVCSVLAQHCKVNVKCGLHVHHGVNSNEVINIFRGWLSIEAVVVDGLPASRKANRYCQKLTANTYPVSENGTRYYYGGRGVTMPRIGENFGAWCNNNRLVSDFDRYVTLNPRSVVLRNTVEFRCAAGSIEYEKIAMWVLLTQAIVERAAPQGDICTGEGIESVLAYIKGHDREMTTSGQIVALCGNRGGRGYMNHRRGSAADYLDRAFTQGVGEAVAVSVLANMGSANPTAKINGHIGYLKAQGLRFEITGERGNRFIKLVPNVMADSIDDLPDADTVSACLWFAERHAQFTGRLPDVYESNRQ